MAGFLLPLAGALVGGISGYLGSPDDNKLGGTITGGLIGGLTGGIGGMASRAMGLGKAATATTTGRMANSGWNPISLLKSAYTPDAMGMMNLGMDAIPLASDIASGNFGLQSFSSFGGTMAGTKFGGRELNKLGNSTYKTQERNAIGAYNYQANQNARQVGLPSAGNAVSSSYGKPQQGTVPSFRQMNPDRDVWVDSQMGKVRSAMENDSKYSKQGYNMPIGMGADVGLYSLTSGINKPKEPIEITQARQQQEYSNSPVSRYLQMTGTL